MIVTRPAAERGHFDHGWLDTSHTFSFAGYHDPAHMGFRTLRVINEDRVAAGRGLRHARAPRHGDRDLRAGGRAGARATAWATGSVIRARRRPAHERGHRRRPTARSTRRRTEPVHFLQIWILPERRGLAPGYEQKASRRRRSGGALRLVASRDGRDGGVTIHQDVDSTSRASSPASG